MDAWALTNPGPDWELRRVERRPEDLPPDGVRVKMKAAALSARDLLIARGTYAFAARAPIVALSDGAGIVLEVGDEVSAFRPGDSVTTTYFPAWADGRLSLAKAAVQLG